MRFFLQTVQWGRKAWVHLTSEWTPNANRARFKRAHTLTRGHLRVYPDDHYRAVFAYYLRLEYRGTGGAR